MAVGFGYDVHRLEKGHSLIIGGVTLESERGTVAHSDGDVLLHAIMDALLGAAALGDIGHHFPDTDPRYHNISSIVLLKEVHALLTEKNLSIINIDATLVLESPKIAPHVEQMRKNITGALGIGVSAISIKATTSEGLGFVGEGRGVVGMAVAQVEHLQ